MRGPAGQRTAGAKAAPPRRRARERIAAERAARKRAAARRRFLVAGGAVTTVPAATLAQVNSGQAVTLLEKVNKPGPALTMNGKLQVVFVSEESCPFCAAERWALTVALSRFGTWSQLGMNSVDQSGAVPFLDIGNQYILAGAQYDPQVLAGLSAAQIASQLGTSSSPVAQAIDGAAKMIIPAINQALRAEPGRG